MQTFWPVTVKDSSEISVSVVLSYTGDFFPLLSVYASCSSSIRCNNTLCIIKLNHKKYSSWPPEWLRLRHCMRKCFKLLLSSFPLCFWEFAWSGILVLNTQNCKYVRMSVDAGDGKLKWPKAIKKVNKQTNKKIKKRKRVVIEHVQEWPHVQLSTSHTHINFPVVLWDRQQVLWL